MKRTFLAVSLLALSSAFAAEVPKPELFMIHEEIVKPSSVMSYETASQDFVKALAEKNVANVRVTAFVSPDMHYYFLTSLNGFGSLDTMHAEWDKAKAAVGASRWNELEAHGNAAISSYNDFIIMKRADLSYTPAAPRLSIAEHKVNFWDFYYLMPGKEQEAEAIAREYAALLKAKNIPESYTICTGVLGSDLPLLLVSSAGRSLADLATADERIHTTLAAEVKPLQARAMAITRRFERRQLTMRPDLSYSPPAPAAAK